nr:hypothetical protein [Tanacetum cinerariifolium]
TPFILELASLLFWEFVVIDEGYQTNTKGESEQPTKKKSNKQKMKCIGKMKQTRNFKKNNIEESPKRFTRCDAKKQAKNEYLNEESKGENDEDEIRPATKSENEETMVEKTKAKKYWIKKEASTSKEKKMKRLKKKRIWDRMRRIEEARVRKKGWNYKGNNTKSPRHAWYTDREEELEDLEQRTSNDPFITEWEAEYSYLGKPTPPAIALQVLEAAFAPQNKPSEAAEDDCPSATNGAGSSVPVTSLRTISDNISASHCKQMYPKDMFMLLPKDIKSLCMR